MQMFGPLAENEWERLFYGATQITWPLVLKLATFHRFIDTTPMAAVRTETKQPRYDGLPCLCCGIKTVHELAGRPRCFDCQADADGKIWCKRCQPKVETGFPKAPTHPQIDQN